MYACILTHKVLGLMFAYMYRCISALSSKLSNMDDVRSRTLLEDISNESCRINDRITELTVV